ncbi:cyanoexosortase C [Dendronalium sp. ChiSLP03b]|uniref:cyanoexosortase C n=1 Tax=Dendronalium sp. ChiSLP03b TaxID=3075381 RepID=UPI002AD208C0|nr:cyanoexosortase C [Dendronalium sp. ChiSLP03b]MDZ8203164.1 cyanoexosortase C [Dendronalium sp. ChiSLP03b]
MNSYKKYVYKIQQILPIYLAKNHNRIVLCGLAIGLYYYLSFWLKTLTQFLIGGSTFPLLTVTTAYLALQELWQQKNQLAKLNPAIIQRRLGHSLILFGVGLFPYSLNKGWSQALVWLVILVGIVLSTWGLKFFKRYKRQIFLMILSIYPGIYSLPGYIWRAFTPERTMDRIQAWSVNLALHTIGYPSSIDETWVKLPTGSVDIGWGCNGFDLMVLMLVTSLLIGMVYRLKGFQILTISFLGCILAFTFNTARIALLAISVAYWDVKAFDFWHDGWGGQIFSAVMFTAFYYLLIQLRLLDFERKSKLH